MNCRAFLEDIKKNGVSMFSTLIYIDDGEVTSVGSSTAYVIKTDGTELLATGDTITFGITTTQGTPAKGCSMTADFGAP